MQSNITDILREWFYRLPNGYAMEPYDNTELQVLSKILKEQGIDSTRIIQHMSGEIVEVENLQRPSINATDLKEGLVCIAIETLPTHKSIIEEVVTLLFEKPTDKSIYEILGDKITPFLNNAITSAEKESHRMPGGAEWLDWFFNTPLLDARTSRKTFMNGFSAGNAILTTNEFKFPSSALVDRSKVLDGIKKYASKAIEKGWKGDAELKFGPDRWSPADIMIFKDGGAPSNITSYAPPGAPTIGNEESLNGIFHNEPGSDKPVIAISLKEAKAQGGKVSTFSKMIKPSDTWPDGASASSTPEEKDQLRTLFLLTPEPGQPVPAIAKYGDHNGPYDQERGMQITPNVFKSNPTDKYLDRKWNERIGDLKRSLKTDKLAESLFGSEVTEKWFDVTLHEKYKQTVRNELIDLYTEQRKAFKTNLQKYSAIKLNDQLYDIKDLSEFNMMKKLAIARYFNYVVANFNAGDFKGTVLTQLAQASGPLVALTMMAVGQSGASPTFYKCFGSEKSLDGGKVEIFHGDGELRLSDNQELTLNDSPKYGGYNVSYNVDVYNGDTKHSTHATDLDLRFSKWVIRVEIGKYSQI